MLADVFLDRDVALNDECSVESCERIVVVHSNTLVLCFSSLIWFTRYCMGLGLYWCKVKSI